MGELILKICIGLNAFNNNPLDCNTLLAIATVESSLNPNAVGSSHGEVGLMQLRPEFHKCAVKDPAVNTRCAYGYLSRLKRKLYKQHGEAYIVFYNTGPNSDIKYPRKHKYFKKVTKIKKKLADKKRASYGQ